MSSVQSDSGNSTAKEGDNANSAIESKHDGQSGTLPITPITQQAIEALIDDVEKLKIIIPDISKISTTVNDTVTKVNELEKGLYPNMISVFGIFTIVITFLSISIQIFNVVCDPWKLIGLVMVVASIMLAFAYVILYFFHSPIGEEVKLSSEAKDDFKSTNPTFNKIIKQFDGFFVARRPSRIMSIVMGLFIVGTIFMIVPPLFFGSMQCRNDKIDLLLERVSRLEGLTDRTQGGAYVRNR